MRGRRNRNGLMEGRKKKKEVNREEVKERGNIDCCGMRLGFWSFEETRNILRKVVLKILRWSLEREGRSER